MNSNNFFPIFFICYLFLHYTFKYVFFFPHSVPGYPCDGVSGFWLLVYVPGALRLQQLRVQRAGGCHGRTVGHHPKWLSAVSPSRLEDPNPVKKVIKWLRFLSDPHHTPLWLIVFPE